MAAMQRRQDSAERRMAEGQAQMDKRMTDLEKQVLELKSHTAAGSGASTGATSAGFGGEATWPNESR
eukprot:3390599-Pyramimonas_sp.AAC.1